MTCLKRYIIGLTTVLVAFVLTGCSHSLNAQLQATTSVNTNEFGRPSPIVVSVFELKSDELFNSADFFQLYQNPKEILGEALVTHKEFEMTPGSRYELNLTLDDEAQFIGVIAAYSNLQNSNWRAIQKFDFNWGTENYLITLGKNSISIAED